MKIVAINSSHRGKNGYTQFLIDKLFEGAAAAGAGCETIILADRNVLRCKGCFSCQREGRLKQCVFDGKDDTQSIYDKMREVDLLVFATPVYVFNMSSLLKNLLDRFPSTSDCNKVKVTKSRLMFHEVDEELCSKPFATIVCQDNLETETHKNILSYFKTYSRFMDAPYIGSIVRRSGALAGQGKDPAKIQKYPDLKEAYDAIVKAGEELAVRGRIRRRTERKANRRLIRVPAIVRLLSGFPSIRKEIEKRSGEYTMT